MWAIKNFRFVNRDLLIVKTRLMFPFINGRSIDVKSISRKQIPITPSDSWGIRILRMIGAKYCNLSMLDQGTAWVESKFWLLGPMELSWPCLVLHTAKCVWFSHWLSSILIFESRRNPMTGFSRKTSLCGRNTLWEFICNPLSDDRRPGSIAIRATYS